MSPELTQRLRAAHAVFFAHAAAPAEIACGDGWFALLDELFTALAPLLAATAHLSNPPRLYEVGSRGGRLKVLLRPLTPEMAALIHRAEALAEKTDEYQVGGTK
jgi:hypothetical protein